MAIFALLAGLAAAQVEHPPCTAANAIAVAVESVARDPGRWIGRCVAVSGLVQYHSLYSGVEGLYLTQRRDPVRYTLRGNLRHRIGLSGDIAWPERLEGWTVAGTVDSCERIAREIRRESDEINRRYQAEGSDRILISMPAGYCHYSPGAVLNVTAVQRGPEARYERLVGPAARESYGNLERAQPGWHRYADFRRRAEAFRAAIRAGDRERLSALHGRFGANRHTLDRLLQDPDSPFRELRGGPAFPFVILYHAFDEAGRPPEEQRHQDGYICYCRAPDCDGRWPISTIDTGSGPEHPYVCVAVYEDASGAVFMNTGLRAGPLQEPARTAFGGSN